MANLIYALHSFKTIMSFRFQSLTISKKLKMFRKIHIYTSEQDPSPFIRNFSSEQILYICALGWTLETIISKKNRHNVGTLFMQMGHERRSNEI